MKNLLFLLLLTILGCATPPQIGFQINYHPEKFKIDLTKTTQVKTEHGLKINFNQEVIERIYGLTKTYNIEVRVNEFYTIEDFVFNNLETISTDGELLESAGMFKIELFYDDNFKIDLENARGISLEIPTSFFDHEVYNYKIFEGVVTEKGMRWNVPQELEILDSEEESIIIDVDSLGVFHGGSHLSDFYSHDLNNLNWINIDRLLELGDEGLEEINFSIENKYQNLSIGIIIPGAKSYISLYPSEGDENNYVSNITLPKGENISIIGLGNDDGKYFLAIAVALVVGKTDLVELNFEEIPNESLPERLK